MGSEQSKLKPGRPGLTRRFRRGSRETLTDAPIPAATAQALSANWPAELATPDPRTASRVPDSMPRPPNLSINGNIIEFCNIDGDVGAHCL
jgi:hypothetical protein